MDVSWWAIAGLVFWSCFVFFLGFMLGLTDTRWAADEKESDDGNEA